MEVFVQYSRSLVIVTGHSGAPVQPMVDRIVSSASDHIGVTPVGSEKSLGYRSRDIQNAMNGGKAAVVAAYDPGATSVLQDWAEREGIETHTVFVKAPQELSFSRAMGNWQQIKGGQPADTLLPEIEPMSESDLLNAFERGEVAVMDKPHYRSEMAPKEMLRRFSAIIHSEPMWEDSISHDQAVEFEPAFGAELPELASQVVEQHANISLEKGVASPDPAPEAAATKAPSPGQDNSPTPRF